MKENTTEDFSSQLREDYLSIRENNKIYARLSDFYITLTVLPIIVQGGRFVYALYLGENLPLTIIEIFFFIVILMTALLPLRKPICLWLLKRFHSVPEDFVVDEEMFRE